MGRCMYPISFVLDSLRNDVRRFDTTIEAGTGDSLELARIVHPASTAKAKIAKYIKVSLLVLGLGLLSVVALRGLYSTGVVTSTDNPPQALSCQYMTISLIRGKLVPGPQGAEGRQTSLARRQCSTHQTCAGTNVLPRHPKIGENANSW
jgi:hypothetical protein